MVRRWLQQMLTPAKMKSFIAGWLTTWLGAGAFVALLELGVIPLISNLACKVSTTQVRFAIHRKFTWPDARHAPLWKQWGRYQLQKGITTAVNNALFLLTTRLECHYLVAYFGCTLLVMPLSHWISKYYTFKEGA